VTAFEELSAAYDECVRRCGMPPIEFVGSPQFVSRYEAEVLDRDARAYGRPEAFLFMGVPVRWGSGLPDDVVAAHVEWGHPGAIA
jgi:hypothetical protein